MKLDSKQGNEQAEKSKCCNHCKLKGFALLKVVDFILKRCPGG
ncbi:MAG TPA: hypothetical protein VMC42_02510 [Methanoregulaceae archaeon]|nr:hypothetical protein [Methanoregulaceae archaeon]